MNKIIECVRNLRKNQTQSEKKFWTKVRKKQIKNTRILRQFPIIFDYENTQYFFVADFYCAKKKLVIEIDGKIHYKQKEKDEDREFIIKKLGLKIVRFKNEEVLNNIDSVIEKLRKYL